MSEADAIHVGIDILKVTRDDATGSIMLQTGDAHSGHSESDRVELWQQAGFASMPSEPTGQVSSCQGIVIKRGDIDACVATKDPRGQQIYGNLGPGETCVYAAGRDGNSQGRLMIRTDGSVTLMTTENNKSAASGAKPVAFRISPSGGLEFTSQFGSITLDAAGFRVKVAAGPRFEMSGLNIPGLSAIPGIGSLVNTMGSHITLTAPFINVLGATTTLGMGPLYNSAAVGFPTGGAGPPITPGLPATIASIGALSTSGTVYVSQ